ncbi:von Willebrand factor A domain-containing protein 7 [Betta splendens]|uniref:von Willebrand factor A domain-containing protein 7 n=1 Tax=Betta splendens TaxID=158456 RepID=A0A6P7P4U7_BETSP|nr:von Willebrand factor A domain-containing protein 7 [Betta splendens]XP_055370019.1 von Willebrand factor A domain-containing protein 7 [Betta splendens]
MTPGRAGLWGGRGKRMCGFILAYLLLPSPCLGFLPNFWSRVLTLSWDSHTHQYITEQAILNVTVETLRDSSKRGNQADDLTGLGRGFWRAVAEVVRSNAATDFLSSTRSDPLYHFDSERVEQATLLLRRFWAQTLLSVRAKEYQSARHSLGRLFHSLQDFYSHSNWVEMGQRSIYLHLLQPEEPAVPVAQDDAPTCMECFSATCRNNLLPGLTQSQLLTTGYFSDLPPKPPGKCSHGGILDSSRYTAAKGGINKDSTSPLFSPHHYLHEEAAVLATEATMTVLRDLRDTVGHRSFLRLFSVRQVPALVFVIDTTGSMGNEIDAAKLRAESIVQSRANSAEQPGKFVLVPFHDPDVGPVYETDDPEQFKESMLTLMALGGGDEPEMCLSAIHLALVHSPPLSEIFVFTDASPKDAHLFDAVKALALEKQSKVTFLLTEDAHYRTGSRGRRKRSGRETLPPDRFSLYSSLSSLSGGLTIFTSDSDIHSVSAIVVDNIAADKVTLLHETTQRFMSNHSFSVDSSVQTITLHVTGTLIEIVLINPSDESQSLLSSQGPLAKLEPFKGLYRISLLPPIQPGQWRLRAKSNGPLTFQVIGNSSVDFLYYFATVNNGTHPGLARVEGNPVAGVSTFLVLAVTGLPPDETASFSHVTLVGAEGDEIRRVWLNASSSFGSVEELVGWLDSVPRVPFCIRLTGKDGSGNRLERVSTEMVQPTHVQIEVLSSPRLVPGDKTPVDFDILNHGPARALRWRASDDCGFVHTKEPQEVHVPEHGSFRGHVDLVAPASAQAGATVTLTFTVHALDSPDSNYAVAYLTVVPPDSDVSPPSCSAAGGASVCPSACNESTWTLSVLVSDSGRSGLAALQLQRGEGTLTLLHHLPREERVDQRQAPRDKKTQHRHHYHHSIQLEKGQPPFNVSLWVGDTSQPLRVSYTSSCCSARAELLVWDAAGNLKRCHLMSRQQRPPGNRNTDANGTGQIRPTVVFFLLLPVAVASVLH